MTMLKDYLKKQELTIIAARPAMGKTTFALRLASELCNEQQSVLYCSLEMDIVRLKWTRTNWPKDIMTTEKWLTIPLVKV